MTGFKVRFQTGWRAETDRVSSQVHCVVGCFMTLCELLDVVLNEIWYNDVISD